MAGNINNRDYLSFFNPSSYGSLAKISLALVSQIPAESIFSKPILLSTLGVSGTLPYRKRQGREIPAR